jgi:hypothetical protein
VFEIVKAQPYTFATTATLRELMNRAGQASRLLDLTSEVIPGIWSTHPNAAGILSTLLSVAVDLWQPTMPVLEKLTQLCERARQDGDWTQVASVEPLAFALCAKGQADIYRQILERLVEDWHWRESDALRIREYYGTVGVEIAAIFRHWQDPFRQGLIRANDVARLMDLLLSADKTLAKSSTQKKLLDLLDQHASILKDNGEFTLATRVNELVVALRLLRTDGHTT